MIYRTTQSTGRQKAAASDRNVRGTPPARRERGELSFAPAPVLHAAGGGLSNNRWSLFGLMPSATVRRLPSLDRLGSARPVIRNMREGLNEGQGEVFFKRQRLWFRSC
jgi:hypothetical protein